MESTLHRQLKERHADPVHGVVEYREGCYRADAIGPGGEWIEVQTGALGPLRPKLARLLPGRAVRIVKPVVLERWIVRLEPGGRRAESAPRRSPRRGALLDVFDELVQLMGCFPHPNLRVEVLGVAVDEVRMPIRRRPGFEVLDRRLREIRTSVGLVEGGDLWDLLPATRDALGEPFTTRELDRWLGRGLAFAQRVAYSLRRSGAVESCGFEQRRRLYRAAAADAARVVVGS